MTDTDREFFDIANEIVSDEANEALEGQLLRVIAWRKDRIAEGESAELRDLISQLHGERHIQRGPMLGILAAACWRLLEADCKL